MISLTRPCPTKQGRTVTVGPDSYAAAGRLPADSESRRASDISLTRRLSHWHGQVQAGAGLRVAALVTVRQATGTGRIMPGCTHWQAVLNLNHDVLNFAWM